MADYRSQVDVNNQKALGMGSVIDSANSLADFLKQSQQFKDAQAQELVKQQKGHENDIDKDVKKRTAEQQQLMDMMGATNLKDAMSEATRRGQSIHMGDVSVGQDPYAKLVQNDKKGLSSAIATSNNQYMKNLPKLQGAAQKIHEGMALINDPKQIGSAGAAKSLIISGVAEMNRYNQQEGSDLVPSTSLQQLQQYANKLGDDKNPLSDTQRAAINHMFVGALGSLKQKHDVLKQSAVGTFETSPYYDAQHGEALKRSMGAPLDAQLNNDMQQYAKYGADQQMMPPPGQNPPTAKPGFVNKMRTDLANLLSPKPSPQAPPQVGQQTPSIMPAAAPGMATPQAGPESEEQEYLRLKQKHGR